MQVHDLQKRQNEETAREERRLKAIADKEAAEKARKAHLKLQEEAFALQLNVSTELSCSSIHTSLHPTGFSVVNLVSCESHDVTIYMLSFSRFSGACPIETCFNHI